ncbi:MAG TPA: SDR family oxidoreductase [Anaerolineaceae bacterium]|nr:SDR family oxidoreductase [Anaerolineaceae bacterium]
MEITNQNKIALITGGSSGIGLAIAEKLASQGAHVWILGRSPDRLASAMARLEAKRYSANQTLCSLAADVSDLQQVNHAVAEVEARSGTLDLLVNSAGIAYPGYFETLDPKVFRDTIEINYLGTVYATKAVIPGMMRRGSGHIVNISSMAGLIGVYGYTAYGGSKYAVRGFSDVLRAEMKPYGVRVSIAFPPDTDTPQLAFENQIKPPETRAIAGSASIMQPEVVAEAILKGVRRNQYMIIPNLEGKLIYHAGNLLGNLIYPVMDLLVAQARQNQKNGRHSA